VGSLTALVVAGGALLAACGGSGSASPTTTAPARTPASALLDAYASTVATGTARVSETIDASSSVRTVDVTAAGVLDFTSKRLAMSLTEPTIGTVQVRLDLPEAYLTLPPADMQGLPPGVSWLSFDVDKVTSGALGTSLSSLSSSAESSTNQLALIEAAASGPVRTLGPATIRGVPTTGYAATVDAGKLYTDARVRAAVEQLLKQVDVTEIPLRIWIDAQGRVRRITIDTTVAAKGSEVAEHVTVDYYDFGVAVPGPPPASQTYDITSMLGSSRGSL
jgi:hypothetical protein